MTTSDSCLGLLHENYSHHNESLEKARLFNVTIKMFNQYDSFSGFAYHYTLKIFSLGLFLAKFPPTCFSTFQALRFFSSVSCSFPAGEFSPHLVFSQEKSNSLSLGENGVKNRMGCVLSTLVRHKTQFALF